MSYVGTVYYRDGPRLAFVTIRAETFHEVATKIELLNLEVEQIDIRREDD